MQSSIRLGRIGGIEVGIHYTWLLAFALITFSIAMGLRGVAPRWGLGTYWLVGAAAAILLFVSVLIHELCHSFVARARGMRVHSITLFMFGGASNILGEARTPWDEFLVAIVGPISSLILGAILFLLIGGLRPRTLLEIGIAPASRTPLFFLLAYLAQVNIALGLFNLVPGFPLDGGRVLRSIIWAVSGSLRQATVWASYVGQLVGWGLIAFGVIQVLSGNFFGGLWMSFIGWFLNNAAETTRQQSETVASFRGIRVRDLMTPSPAVASPDMSVEQLVYDFAVRQGMRALPVVQDGRLLGIVTLSDIREHPQERWPALTVADIMTPMPLQTVTPGQSIPEALQIMGEQDLNQLPVVEDSRLVGLLSRANIVRFLQIRDELRLRSPGRRPTGAPTAVD
jgi:Zn-dependent protease/CBS domain-containing protein